MVSCCLARGIVIILDQIVLQASGALRLTSSRLSLAARRCVNWRNSIAICSALVNILVGIAFEILGRGTTRLQVKRRTYIIYVGLIVGMAVVVQILKAGEVIGIGHPEG